MKLRKSKWPRAILNAYGNGKDHDCLFFAHFGFLESHVFHRSVWHFGEGVGHIPIGDTAHKPVCV